MRVIISESYEGEFAKTSISDMEGKLLTATQEVIEKLVVQLDSAANVVENSDLDTDSSAIIELKDE